MDSDLLKMLSDQLQETRNLVLETRRMADAATREADAAMRRADASWEFIIMTKNHLQEDLRIMKLPWWKKIFGTTW